MTGRKLQARAIQVGRAVGLTLAAFLIVGVVFELAGFSWFEVFSGVWRGSVAGEGAAGSTLRWSLPLFIVACGVLISFRSGQFNVGAQGQYYAGSIGALVVALAWSDGPAAIVVPVGFLAAMLFGAAWSLIPGILRIRFGTDEVLTTLMMNFIGILLLQYVTSGPFRDRSGSGEQSASEVISAGFRLSDGSGLSVPLVAIAVFVGISTWVLINRTAFGVQGTIAGRNPRMARWQGVDVDRIGLAAFAITGGLAGLAGAADLFGPAGRLVSGSAPALGFSAILVGIVGLLSVPGIAAAALFFGGLQAAVIYLPVVSDLPRSALGMLHGLVALLITVRHIPLIRKLNAFRRPVGRTSQPTGGP